MNTDNLKKLEANICHIHKQKATMSILEDGNLKIDTCCLLFEAQLHLLIEKQDEKHKPNSTSLR